MLAPGSAAAQCGCDSTVVGPPAGSLVLAGGGKLDPAVYRRFLELAGGPDALIVVIPTASEESRFPAAWSGLSDLRRAGAKNVTLLHTRRRDVADSEAFVEPIRRASGVWITGGRAWRLVDAYLDTRTEAELHRLLARGGVVGGTSAGASIMASYLVRGAVTSNEVVMAPGYERGFGFLRSVAVDQHVLERRRYDDLLSVVATHPELLGIGMDEGTALVVQGDRAEVIGRSQVGFYNPSDPVRLFSWYAAGAVYDLAERQRSAAPAEQTPAPEPAPSATSDTGPAGPSGTHPAPTTGGEGGGIRRR